MTEISYTPIPVDQLQPGDEIRFEVPYVVPPAINNMPPGEATTVWHDQVRSIQRRGNEHWISCSESVIAVYRSGEKVSAILHGR